MSTYMVELPKVFPYGYELPIELVKLCIWMLISDNRTDVPNGSSFAITADAPRGYQKLWLSKVSNDHLEQFIERQMKARQSENA